MARISNLNVRKKSSDVIEIYRLLRVLRVFKRTSEYLRGRISLVSGQSLLVLWENEGDPDRKDRFEQLIALKLNSYGDMLLYNPVPHIYDEYLSEVKSIDAIVELVNNPNPKVQNIGRKKFIEFYDKYLEEEAKKNGETCKIIKIGERVE